jgi:hypothetical protein
MVDLHEHALAYHSGASRVSFMAAGVVPGFPFDDTR